MRILLVEDTEDSRELFRIMLEDLGHEVIEATNGKEAVQAAVNYEPQIVLMDLSMPEVDGFQAIAAIRAISSFRLVPIIAITAHCQPTWRDRALQVGCDEYLVKPISPEELSAALDKFSSAA